MLTIQILFLGLLVVSGKAYDPCILCMCIKYSEAAEEIFIDCSSSHPRVDELRSFVLPNNTGVLDLSKNNLEISNEWLIYNQLESLSLSHNSIETIDSDVFKYLKSLRKLDLSHNKLSTLGVGLGSFQGLAALQHLDLSHNYFHYVPSKLLSLTTPRLNVLMIGSNPLGNETFTKWDGPSTLQQVVVDYANISASAIWPDSKIQELNLRGNSLTKVPILPKSLVFLDLSNTKLSFIRKEAFNRTSNLQTLFLEDMPELIEIANEAFQGLKNLTKLSLDGSRSLNFFPAQAFDHAANLLDISMENCNLTTLDEGLSIFTKYASFDLDGNPWICDCELTWLNSQKVETPIICSAPEFLKGRQLPSSSTLCLKGWIRAHSTILVATISAMIALMLTAILLVTWEFVKNRPCMKQTRNRIEKTCPCLKSLNSEDEEELYSFDPYEAAFEPLRL